MANIQVLGKETIDKIAAGEVIERPASVVKELVENAIDAGSTSITVEIKEGGISLIRITDNGSGIAKDDVSCAFLRHATSKIRQVEDLLTIQSLGFRGEALSSISAVSKVELITKTRNNLTGIRYEIEGGVEKTFEEIGAPDGTTFLVRELFYNTPARRKFLKTPQTEGSHIEELMERLALSHPDISFKLLANNQTKLHTTGNGSLKDIIYQIFGKEITDNLISVNYEADGICMTGYIGKPIISRGNRQYENYFVNGRYVKSQVVSKAIEEAYKTHLMQHKYPFTVLLAQFDGHSLDVNVHPTKQELRFADAPRVYQLYFDLIMNGLAKKEMIPKITIAKEPLSKKTADTKTPAVKREPEPFETRRLSRDTDLSQTRHFKEASANYPVEKADCYAVNTPSVPQAPTANRNSETVAPDINTVQEVDPTVNEKQKTRQLSFFEEKIISVSNKDKINIIGQLFDTYWILQYEQQMLIVDQHAAHEKVLFERMMTQLRKKDFTSQLQSPPIILTLSDKEASLLHSCKDSFQSLGFEIELFGGKEYAIRAVPDNLYCLNAKELFLEILDSLSPDIGKTASNLITEKIASMSCKAAVKGNMHLSHEEAKALLEELMELDNPYQCPHGRPVIVSMTKTELEKKFKRIL